MPATKLLDNVRNVARLKHLSLRTERSYVYWIRRFILFHNKRHPTDMAEPEIRNFLSHFAAHENVAASTQNQALSALLFLYRDVLGIRLRYIDDIERAKRPAKVPTVLTRSEVSAVLRQLTGTSHIMTSLLYGSGLRLIECLRLRVKGLDFHYNQITIRDGKGEKDRVTMLPESLKPALQRHLKRVKLLHEEDLSEGVRREHMYPLSEKFYRVQERPSVVLPNQALTQSKTPLRQPV